MPQAPTVAIPQRLPLVITPENRGNTATKDSRLINCYCERQEDKSVWVFKRCGTARSSQPSGGAAAGRGMWTWLGDTYSVFGATLYKGNTSLGTVDATNGVYYWSSCLGSTKKLQLGNGVKAYNYDSSSGLVLINDADFPSSFAKGWGYLDGTTYVLRPDGGIQGDDINTPTDWDALNVIIAQIEPDNGVALAKQLVYIIAMKQWSGEVFYDAGNATGSPLGSVQGAKINFGCASEDSVAQIDDILLWVCTNRTGSPQVIMLSGLKAEIVSTDPIERLLGHLDFTTIYSFVVKITGHRFYVLTSVVSNLTLVYDLDQQLWHQWTDTDGNYFPFVAAVAGPTDLQTYLQHASDGYIYQLDETYYTDNNALFSVDIYTPNYDGGTRRRKQLNMMNFVADQVSGSILQVRSNDFDYDATKWTNFRNVDLSVERPMLMNNGTFKRRAYHFRHRSQTAFRIQAVDLQLDLGTL